TGPPQGGWATPETRGGVVPTPRRGRGRSRRHRDTRLPDAGPVPGRFLFLEGPRVRGGARERSAGIPCALPSWFETGHPLQCAQQFAPGAALMREALSPFGREPVAPPLALTRFLAPP